MTGSSRWGPRSGGASCVRGNLVPECTTAVQAVLDAMGKKRGAEDTRTVGQRFHDALQETCPPLPRVCPIAAGSAGIWRCCEPWRQKRR